MRRLLGQRVYLDSNLLIYFFNAHPTYSAAVTEILTLAARDEVDAVTGDLTIAEVLVQPLAAGDSAAGDAMRDFFASGPVEICSHAREAFEMAAAIRAARRTSLPDALHVATAALAGCSVLVTNDARMPSLPGVEVLRLQDLQELPG